MADPATDALAKLNELSRQAEQTTERPAVFELSHAAGGRICLANCFISYNVRDVAAL